MHFGKIFGESTRRIDTLPMHIYTLKPVRSTEA